MVIIADGEWKGCNAVVTTTNDGGIADSSSLTVTVVPTINWFSSDEEGAQPLTLKRTDIAVWDYPDALWGFPDKKNEFSNSNRKNKRQYTEKVLSILSTLKTDDRSADNARPNNKGEKSTNTFTSARQRKAAAASAKAAMKKSQVRKNKILLNICFDLNIIDLDHVLVTETLKLFKRLNIFSLKIIIVTDFEKFLRGEVL